MPTQKCPRCRSENVRAVMIWRVGPRPAYVTEPPVPMFACQELDCLHKWARSPAAEVTRLQTKWKRDGALACAHRSQCLLDLSPGDTGPMMGVYYCVDCGKEFVRPHEAWPPRN